MADGEQSYIDYDTFLDPAFSPTSFANALVTSTNNASDTPIDLSTPLSRVLFDQQEIDTNIHTLTTKSALPLLSHTQSQSSASQRILTELEQQIYSLSEGYKRLEAEVIQRHAIAEEVRLAVSRLWVTVKIGRAVSRAMQLGRQLDTQMAEVGKPTATPGVSPAGTKREDHRAMVRAAHTILALRALFDASGPGEEGEHISRINVVTTLRTDLVFPREIHLRSKAQQVVREFSLSSLTSQDAPKPASTPSTQTQTYVQTSETKSRTTSACQTLYLLSPPPSRSNDGPALLLQAQHSYLQAALTSSLASLARALASLPTLSRALAEVSARCQNVSGLENLLADIPAPSPAEASPGVKDGEYAGTDAQRGVENLLVPLLRSLDTHSLPSYFWRSLANGLGARVGEILNKGGVPARNLRAQRERVREGMREAVVKGCEGAAVRDEDGRVVQGGKRGGEWEREVMVVVGSVVGGLGR
ncbi:MAG: hypothetical protein MMC23_008471 [Stictis urceolatum]|nr:hypothetical protein [Stictis urceolata]